MGKPDADFKGSEWVDHSTGLQCLLDSIQYKHRSLGVAGQSRSLRRNKYLWMAQMESERQDQFDVEFVPSGRGKAQCDPDPKYPNGVVVDCSDEGKDSCVVRLLYPAPECGWFLVTCKKCRTTTVATAAGRRDDATHIVFPCKEMK